LSDALAEQAAIISGEIRRKVLSLLDKLQTPVASTTVGRATRQNADVATFIFYGPEAYCDLSTLQRLWTATINSS
jgi:hypothetical protein